MIVFSSFFNVFKFLFLFVLYEVFHFAGDRTVRMHSYTYSSSPQVWYSDGRVKRLAVTPADPHLFWSASEDGIIRQLYKFLLNVNL